ncbi:MAG TPA: chorismate pyruvate-lyase family protein [Cellvibrionaceae bacterium]
MPSLLRLLLATDGTVTKALEAYFNVPIKVHLLSQYPTEDVPAKDMLALDSKRVILRTVQLVRTDSDTIMASARSTIALDLLPEDLAEGLLAGHLGIGELIRSQGMDTYRQLRDLGISEREGVLGVWRRYAICKQQEALMQVEEWFPWGVYAGSN